MIAYIKGQLAEITEEGIVLETQDIGYEIRVPSSVLGRLPFIGEKVKIYTYLYVREDALNLYGFLSKDDLTIFKLLITVNGIGPRGAIGILSNISSDDLRFAVLANDIKAISKAPGIGAKTAGKLILELKDKLKLEDAFEKKFDYTQEATQEQSGVRNNAMEALIALGYSNTDAWKAVRQIEITENTDVETVLRLSLKKIGL